jgi:hypothetical protein
MHVCWQPEVAVIKNWARKQPALAIPVFMYVTHELVADDGIVYSSYEQEQNIPAINISDSCA